jgi:murein DD-endopeptidase MepM/ murein hydrolase activator NlpD
MGHDRKEATAILLAIVLACAAAAPARASNPGGSAPGPQGASATGAAQAPALPAAGGSEYGAASRPASVGRPVVGLLSVPATAIAGAPPAVTFRIDERGANVVRVRVTVTDLSTRRSVIVVSMGWVHAGRTVSVRWPRGASLGPGRYHVSLTARDSHSAALLRRAHSSGVATLFVTAPAEPQPAPPPPSIPPAGLATPAQLAAEGAVFPVAGAHTFGGPENRFGAPRTGHTHEGQDVLTSEGTPVEAPLAGVILSTNYQAGGAGYYVAEHTGAGFDFFFAHCMAGSLAVAAEASVSAGQQLCLAGHTGSATTPHLHIEMWVGGWGTSAGYPVDPLPYLQAWDHAGAGG